MKGLVATIAVAAVLMGMGGVACGQYYYGGEYANQFQGYDQYGQGQSGYGQYGQAYGGYGQDYGGYNQYSQSQPSYGQSQAPYGQQQYTPMQQGQQAYGNYSYGGYPGYQTYAEPGQSGNYQGYGAGRSGAGNAYSQQPPRRRPARQPAQAQTVAPQNPRVTVTQQPAGRAPSIQSSQSSQTSSRETSSIYWDGRETVEDEMGGTPVQAPPTVQPQGQPGTRQTARSTPGSAVAQPARRAPQSAVRQNTASLPSPPPKRSMRWGKQEKSTTEGADSARMSTVDKPESRRVLPSSASDRSGQASPGAMKWGKQDKPSIVGSEPGSSQGTGALSRSDTAPQEATESGQTAKRFEWGKTR